MHIHTTTVVSLAAALVGVQHMSVVMASSDNDMRAGVPLRIDPVCANAEGQLMCASDTSLMICDHARWTFLSNCPEGTMCQNNRCINSADFTKPADQPPNPPSKAPVPTPTSTSTTSSKPSSTSSTESSMSGSNTKSDSKQSSKSSTKSSATRSSSKNNSSKPSSKPSSIPNVIEVDKMPDFDMDEDDDKPSRSSSSSSGADSQFNMAIPVVAIVVPYILMQLF
ncbi:hypothetical protein GGI09_003497 [Coemansia sp. S100]|nr:hypothetical protein LPJ71_001067 [Coemansia sp. S17]KAJ2098075.1 hypothetical protein GGI09_003497 [Coemansia sp. S100]KAJ2106474.1 hypothetical protein GGI16_001915 [Coemansia sp. S142-1]